MEVVVIGGGAAGFFAALSVAEHHPRARVTILEKGKEPLGKVRISGGGRCNVTHDCRGVGELVRHYPRGGAFLRTAFRRFGTSDTIEWFGRRGVPLKTEADGRMFPVTDDSATIVGVLTSEARRRGVRVRFGARVSACRPAGDGSQLTLPDGTTFIADRVIVAIGGSPKAGSYDWLAAMGHTIVPPVPSLFTFNMPCEPVRELQGISVPDAGVRVEGTPLEARGPLLITHWGMSGPAILRLSAWGARTINSLGYDFHLRVRWQAGAAERLWAASFDRMRTDHGRKTLVNAAPQGMPSRLWAHLVAKAGIAPGKTWMDTGKRDANRLMELLLNDRYHVQGRTAFKEEFVTAGGVALDEIDPRTMRSLKMPGLYFAGEVMDVDGLTGGFNFQAAWTTGYIAGMLG